MIKTKTGGVCLVLGGMALLLSTVAILPASTLAQTTSSYAQSNCVAFSANIGRGMRNNNVLALQTYLAKTGYFNTEATGYFGNITTSAVKSYQAEHKIDTTGFVGVLTRAAILQESCALGSTGGTSTGNSATTLYNSASVTTGTSGNTSSAGYYTTINGVTYYVTPANTSSSSLGSASSAASGSATLSSSTSGSATTADPVPSAGACPADSMCMY